VGEVNKLNLEKYHVVIFDCDGIIFNTTSLKLIAFQESLSAFKDHQIQDFTEYFKVNFGKSRYSHVRYFISHILKIPFDQNLYQNILNDYGSRSQALYDSAELCSGVTTLLEKLTTVDKYIASGSDQNELRNVFKKRSLEHYFKAIYGSPVAKNQLVKDICLKYRGKNILMIGDAQADYVAAEVSNIDFLYVDQYSADQKNMRALAGKKSFCTVKNLASVI